jgi:hypothetical protein
MRYEFIEDEVPQEETAPAYLARGAARTLARGAESVAGLPGDVGNLGLSLANYGYNKVTGKESPLPKEIPYLPTSQDIREKGTKKLTGEYLEPQSEGEKFYDDIIGDASTILLPLKGKVPFAKSALRALGQSAVGNASKWATESVTGSPTLGTAAKIGSMLLAGTAGTRNQVNNLKKTSYDDAFKALPEGQLANFGHQEQEINKLIKQIKRGDNPDKKFLLERLESFNPLVSKASPGKPVSTGILDASGNPLTKLTKVTKGGEGSVQEMINLKQGWNDHLRDKNLSTTSRNIIKKAVGIVNDGIASYGKKNKAFFEPYKVGEELTNALNSTNMVQDFLSKHPVLQRTASNPIVKHILFYGTGHAALNTPLPQVAAAAGAVGTGAAAAKETARAYQLIMKSPIARKYYKEAVEASLKENVGAAAKSINKLNRVADDFKFEEPEGRYEFVD